MYQPQATLKKYFFHHYFSNLQRLPAARNRSSGKELFAEMQKQ